MKLKLKFILSAVLCLLIVLLVGIFAFAKLNSNSILSRETAVDCNLQAGGRLSLSVLDVNCYSSIYDSDIDIDNALTARELRSDEVFVVLKLKLRCLNAPIALNENNEADFNISFLNILEKGRLSSSYKPDSIWYFSCFDKAQAENNRFYYHFKLDMNEEATVVLGIVADKRCEQDGRMLLQISCLDEAGNPIKKYIQLN